MLTACRWLVLTSTISLVTAPSVWAQPSEPRYEQDLARWVNDLGHDQYLRREKANRKLIEAGPRSIQPLMKAMRSGDLEVIERAMVVITEIGLSQSPGEDGGAWDQLSSLASKGTGQTASRAQLALSEIRSRREMQARIALKSAGVFVGVDEFFARSFSRQRMLVQVDDSWNGDVQPLQWLRWLYGIEHARVEGKGVDAAVLAQVIQVPDLKSIAIVDGVVEKATLEPLEKLERIDVLEFRYVDLKDEYGELIAALPLRMSLELMGTGMSEEAVESIRDSLPGLDIVHRQGGFLGVQGGILPDQACEISDVVPGSAAQNAGLQRGDIIVQAGDARVTNFQDLRDEINLHLPGDELELKFQRGGQTKSVKLQLGKFDDS